jgi:hypothetical protein
MITFADIGMALCGLNKWMCLLVTNDKHVKEELLTIDIIIWQMVIPDKTMRLHHVLSISKLILFIVHGLFLSIKSLLRGFDHSHLQIENHHPCSFPNFEIVK